MHYGMAKTLEPWLKNLLFSHSICRKKKENRKTYKNKLSCIVYIALEIQKKNVPLSLLYRVNYK